LGGNGNVLILVTEREVGIVAKEVILDSTKPTYLCRRCGRKLRSDKSKERGMGNTCYHKWYEKDNHKKLFPSLQSREDNI